MPPRPDAARECAIHPKSTLRIIAHPPDSCQGFFHPPAPGLKKKNKKWREYTWKARLYLNEHTQPF